MTALFPIGCCKCGAPLQVHSDVTTFACTYCGTAQTLTIEGGVAFSRLDSLHSATQRTAAELAIARLREELPALRNELDRLAAKLTAAVAGAFQTRFNECAQPVELRHRAALEESRTRLERGIVDLERSCQRRIATPQEPDVAHCIWTGVVFGAVILFPLVAVALVAGSSAPADASTIAEQALILGVVVGGVGGLVVPRLFWVLDARAAESARREYESRRSALNAEYTVRVSELESARTNDLERIRAKVYQGYGTARDSALAQLQPRRSELAQREAQLSAARQVVDAV
jgi:multidrug resistance efflux pump